MTTTRCAAWNGSEWLVVYQNRAGVTVHSARLDAQGKLIGTAAVPMPATQNFFQPNLASDGQGYLLVGRPLNSFGMPIREVAAHRFGPDGALITAAPFVVSAGTQAMSGPALIWNGESYLVAWTHLTTDLLPKIRATRLSPAGNILDPDGIVVPGVSRADDLALAWNGTNHLVAWQEFAGEQVHSVEAVRLSRTGAPVDQKPLRVAGPGTRLGQLNAMALHADFLVAWTAPQDLLTSTLRLARINTDGALMDPNPIAAVDFDSNYNGGRPALAAIGSVGMVAVDGYWSREANLRLRGRMFDQGGAANPSWQPTPDASEADGPTPDRAEDAGTTNSTTNAASGCDCHLGPRASGHKPGFLVLPALWLLLLIKRKRTEAPGPRVCSR